jgi:Tfp pilus assembly protein PilX
MATYPARPRLPQRRGATLIDVAIGSMLLSILLIPAVQMIGNSQSCNRRLANRACMLFEAEQIIENAKIQLSDAATFDKALTNSIDDIGKIAEPDGPLLLGRLQVAADPTMPKAKLVTITAQVWQDADSDGLFDSSEQGESLTTQWAAP